MWPSWAPSPSLIILMVCQCGRKATLKRKTARQLTDFRDLWRNQLRQWLEEGCREAVLGAGGLTCPQAPVPIHHDYSWRPPDGERGTRRCEGSYDPPSTLLIAIAGPGQMDEVERPGGITALGFTSMSSVKCLNSNALRVLTDLLGQRPVTSSHTFRCRLPTISPSFP